MTNFNRLLAVFTIVLFGLSPAFVFAGSTSSPQADTGGSGNVALNWSGYVSQSGTYTAVSGSWIVPTVSSVTNNSADATWVGIGGVLSHDLIQAGTEAVPNSSGSISYQAWYELLPSGSVTVPLTVHPGDSMTVSVTEESSATGTWLIVFSDNTTGKTYQTTVRYASSLSSAEWIEEMPAGVGQRLSLDDFGTVDFTSGTTVQNGESVSISGSGAAPITMQNEAGQELAIPSILNGNGGFTVTRTDAASSSVAVNQFGNPVFAYSATGNNSSGYVSSHQNDGYGGRGNRRFGGGTSRQPNFTVIPEQGGGFQIVLYSL